MIRVGDLIRQQLEQRVVGYPAEATLDPKFLGTLAGMLFSLLYTVIVCVYVGVCVVGMGGILDGRSESERWGQASTRDR